MARAIWKGSLVLGKDTVPVKMYSAIEDRAVHFRLLHAKDLSSVRQKIVRKTDGKEVPREAQLKAYPVSADTAVILRPDELADIEPEASREIRFCRFVPAAAIGDQWYDRPYYLGPDGDAGSYSALAQALKRSGLLGIARWTMRKKRYVGALTLLEGHLMMITLRRAEQVLVMSGIRTPAAAKPAPKELKLARQLVSAIAGEFDPALWQDEYHERVCRMIEAKARGKAVELRAPKRKAARGELAEVLRRSVARLQERKVA